MVSSMMVEGCKRAKWKTKDRVRSSRSMPGRRNIGVILRKHDDMGEMLTQKVKALDTSLYSASMYVLLREKMKYTSRNVYKTVYI